MALEARYHGRMDNFGAPVVSFEDLEEWVRSEIEEYGVRLSKGEGQRPDSRGDMH